jgi:hypothetical protein
VNNFFLLKNLVILPFEILAIKGILPFEILAIKGILPFGILPFEILSQAS